MNRYDFTNRAAVVTGGAQGIGYAVAQRLFEGGARVSLWDRDEAALANARARLGDVQTVLVDLTDRDAVANATSRTLERFGQIDVLVHSAGIAGANATVADYAPEEWSRVIDVDLNAAFHVNQAIVRAMIARGYGRIVNIASIMGVRGQPESVPYSAAKGAIVNFTRAVAADLGRHGITVNAIAPGFIDTRMAHLPDGSGHEHDTDWFKDIYLKYGRILLGRAGRPEDIAGPVYFLCSDDAAYVTGQILLIDGGVSATF